MAPLEIEINDRDPGQQEGLKLTMQASSGIALNGPLGIAFVRVEEDDLSASVRLADPPMPVQVEYMSKTEDFRKEGSKFILHDNESITFTPVGEQYPKLKLTKTAAK